MLERKRDIPPITDGLDIQQITDDISVVQNVVAGQYAHVSYTGWITTPEGVVVVDPGNYRACSLIKEAIEQPAKYLIYTHAHADHIGGAAAFSDHNPKVIAHENSIERLDRYALTAGYIRLINSIQFHFRIPANMPRDASVRRFPSVYPTEIYSDKYRFKLGGRTFELFHGKGETDDHTLMWIPELRTVFCGDLLEASFPNLGNPFKVMRYAREWAEALEKVIALDPDLAIGGDLILLNRSKINEVISEHIELLRFLEDSVVRAANEGKNLEQMIAEIQLPSHLENSPNLRQIYSRREFAIYNIWKRYCGYFDFSPSGLLPRPKREVAAVVRELIGEDKLIIAKAEKLLQEGELQLAMETLDIILKVDYGNVAARKLRLEVLNKLFETDICLMSRNVWLYYLEEDRDFLGMGQ